MPISGGQTLGKAMRLLRIVSAAEDGVTFSALQLSSRQPKATLHRLIQSLMEQRLVRFDADDRRYRLGYGLLELAGVAWTRLDVRRAAADVLLRLNQEVGEAVHLAVLDAADVIYIDKIESSQKLRMASAIGMRNPAYCTGVGKAILAHLDSEELERVLDRTLFEQFTPRTITNRRDLMAHLREVRRDGVAVDNEEHEPGIRCVAAAIFEHRGRPIASVSITTPTFRCDDRRLGELASRVAAAAGEITRNCGGAAPEAENAEVEG